MIDYLACESVVQEKLLRGCSRRKLEAQERMKGGISQNADNGMHVKLNARNMEGKIKWE